MVDEYTLAGAHAYVDALYISESLPDTNVYYFSVDIEEPETATLATLIDGLKSNVQALEGQIQDKLDVDAQAADSAKLGGLSLEEVIAQITNSATGAELAIKVDITEGYAPGSNITLDRVFFYDAVGDEIEHLVDLSGIQVVDGYVNYINGKVELSDLNTQSSVVFKGFGAVPKEVTHVNLEFTSLYDAKGTLSVVNAADVTEVFGTYSFDAANTYLIRDPNADGFDIPFTMPQGGGLSLAALQAAIAELESRAVLDGEHVSTNLVTFDHQDLVLEKQIQDFDTELLTREVGQELWSVVRNAGVDTFSMSTDGVTFNPLPPLEMFPEAQRPVYEALFTELSAWVDDEEAADGTVFYAVTENRTVLGPVSKVDVLLKDVLSVLETKVAQLFKDVSRNHQDSMAGDNQIRDDLGNLQGKVYDLNRGVVETLAGAPEMAVKFDFSTAWTQGALHQIEALEFLGGDDSVIGTVALDQVKLHSGIMGYENGVINLSGLSYFQPRQTVLNIGDIPTGAVKLRVVGTGLENGVGVLEVGSIGAKGVVYGSLAIVENLDVANSLVVPFAVPKLSDINTLKDQAADVAGRVADLETGKLDATAQAVDSAKLEGKTADELLALVLGQAGGIDTRAYLARPTVDTSALYDIQANPEGIQTSYAVASEGTATYELLDNQTAGAFSGLVWNLTGLPQGVTVRLHVAEVISGGPNWNYAGFTATPAAYNPGVSTGISNENDYTFTYDSSMPYFMVRGDYPNDDITKVVVNLAYDTGTEWITILNQTGGVYQGTLKEVSDRVTALEDQMPGKLGVNDQAADSAKLEGKSVADLTASSADGVAGVATDKFMTPAASKDAFDARWAEKVGAAPETLDTIEEIAAALLNNADALTAVEAVAKQYTDTEVLAAIEQISGVDMVAGTTLASLYAQVVALQDTKLDKTATAVNSEKLGGKSLMEVIDSAIQPGRLFYPVVHVNGSLAEDNYVMPTPADVWAQVKTNAVMEQVDTIYAVGVKRLLPGNLLALTSQEGMTLRGAVSEAQEGPGYVIMRAGIDDTEWTVITDPMLGCVARLSKHCVVVGDNTERFVPGQTLFYNGFEALRENVYYDWTLMADKEWEVATFTGTDLLIGSARYHRSEIRIQSTGPVTVTFDVPTDLPYEMEVRFVNQTGVEVTFAGSNVVSVPRMQQYTLTKVNGVVRAVRYTNTSVALAGDLDEAFFVNPDYSAPQP